MNIRTERSEELYKKACEFMPGGVNSPVRACRNVGTVPLFIKSASGSKIYDEDGNEFIDYVCSWGPNILGHSFKPVTDAVKAACDSGLTFGACHKGEITLAEIIQEHFPSMEMLRLVNSGTEAVMSAVRAARGFTGRDKIIKFEGCYHGHSDGLLVKAGSGLMTHSIPSGAGVTEGCTKDTLLAKYNDEDSVEKLFNEYGNDIAALIVEPCAANMGVVPPKKGFLKFLREITEKYGAMLIFDEVITGFRLSAGGAQELFGVTPDLTTLGKIVGGGMPLAAYGGKREIMECIAPLGSVYQAGTLSGNPCAVAAGIETIRQIEAVPDFYTKLDEKAARLEKAMTDAGLNVNRCGSLLTVFFNSEKVVSYDESKACDTESYARYYRHMLSEGIYTAPSQFEAMFVSNAHSDEDIERTIDAVRKFSK